MPCPVTIAEVVILGDETVPGCVARTRLFAFFIISSSDVTTTYWQICPRFFKNLLKIFQYGIQLGVAEDFLRANREVWSLVEKQMEDPSRIVRIVKVFGFKYDLVVNTFSVANAFIKNISLSMNMSVEHMKKLSTIGLHIAMFQSREFVQQLLSEAGVESNEIDLGKAIGLRPDVMRECLEHVFDSMLNATLPRLKECHTYWSRGIILPHLGALAIAVSDKPPPGDPRTDVINALVPWVLSIVRDMVSGSHGAGSIAVFGASIGQGKTSTLYYTLRSVLYLLGHPNPDHIVPHLMTLDMTEFLEVMSALAESDEKAMIIVVDNASIIFPKQWHRYGGELNRFFLEANRLIDMLRGKCGATIFVANAPDELASFIRNASTMNMHGREVDVKSYKVTVFTWKKTRLVSAGEESRLKQVEQPASIYVYPFLKLPLFMYAKDLEVKKKAFAESISRLLKETKEKLETQSKKAGQEQDAESEQ
jgi:hypothetical protein